MIAIWIVIALFAIGDTAVNATKDAAPTHAATTASLNTTTTPESVP